jgi:hypothetical protein
MWAQAQRGLMITGRRVLSLTSELAVSIAQPRLRRCMAMQQLRSPSKIDATRYAAPGGTVRDQWPPLGPSSGAWTPTVTDPCEAISMRDGDWSAAEGLVQEGVDGVVGVTAEVGRECDGDLAAPVLREVRP